MPFEVSGTFTFQSKQRERFRSGGLSRTWRERYPELFDDDDLRTLRTEYGRRYHFFEWLAAILIYESTGYLSLVEQYEFDNHPRKREILRRIVSPELFALIIDHQRPNYAQCPDLLVYAPDLTDWLFCEVKGPGDEIKPNQRDFFNLLFEKSGKPIKVVQFREFNGGE